MDKRIFFHGMERSDLIEDHVNRQLIKFDRLLEDERSPIYVGFTLYAERGHHHHRAEVLIKTPHYDLVSHYECPDMYEAIDKAIDKMHLDLEKAKEKRTVNKKTTDAY